MSLKLVQSPRTLFTEFSTTLPIAPAAPSNHAMASSDHAMSSVADIDPLRDFSARFDHGQAKRESSFKAQLLRFLHEFAKLDQRAQPLFQEQQRSFEDTLLSLSFSQNTSSNSFIQELNVDCHANELARQEQFDTLQAARSRKFDDAQRDQQRSFDELYSAIQTRIVE